MAKFGNGHNENTSIGLVTLQLQADNGTLLDLWVVLHEVTEPAKMIRGNLD